MKKIKKDFIQDLQKTGIPEADAKRLFELFLDIIINGLLKGKQVHVKNFGVFCTARKKKTVFINPRTGRESHVTRATKARFRPSRRLTAHING